MKKIAFSVLATGSLALLLGVSDVEASSYTIKPGDSLWKIASANKVSVADLKKWNGLTSDSIYANQVLSLAPMASKIETSSKQATVQKPKTAISSEYTVQPGDTLSRVASLHNTKVSEIQKLNSLTSHLIFPGQKLKVAAVATVPAKPSVPVTVPAPAIAPTTSPASYKVVKGDTLSGIAKRHNISVTQLMNWNNLSSSAIRIGQVLKTQNTSVTVRPPASRAPVAPVTPVVPVAPVAAVTPVAAPVVSAGMYTISKGDTLTGIAIRHGISVTQLMNWNNLTSHSIRIGQVLKVQNTVVEIQPDPSPVSSPAPELIGGVGKLIPTALAQVGTPYVWGGATVGGFDCSGFIYYAFTQAGIMIPRTDTVGYDARSYDISDPEVGDLVFFADTYKPGISHMGIYLGNNNFIHAGGDRVQITSLSDKYWGKKFDGFKRFY